MDLKKVFIKNNASELVYYTNQLRLEQRRKVKLERKNETNTSKYRSILHNIKLCKDKIKISKEIIESTIQIISTNLSGNAPRFLIPVDTTETSIKQPTVSILNKPVIKVRPALKPNTSGMYLAQRYAKLNRSNIKKGDKYYDIVKNSSKPYWEEIVELDKEYKKLNVQ